VGGPEGHEQGATICRATLWRIDTICGARLCRIDTKYRPATICHIDTRFAGEGSRAGARG